MMLRSNSQVWNLSSTWKYDFWCLDL